MITKYSNLEDVDILQRKIMLYIGWWARTKKTPISRKEIFTELDRNHIPKGTSESALAVLVKKGFIRRGVGTSNKTVFIQLRTVSDTYCRDEDCMLYVVGGTHRKGCVEPCKYFK